MRTIFSTHYVEGVSQAPDVGLPPPLCCLLWPWESHSPHFPQILWIIKPATSPELRVQCLRSCPNLRANVSSSLSEPRIGWQQTDLVSHRKKIRPTVQKRQKYLKGTYFFIILQLTCLSQTVFIPKTQACIMFFTRPCLANFVHQSIDG